MKNISRSFTETTSTTQFLDIDFRIHCLCISSDIKLKRIKYVVFRHDNSYLYKYNWVRIIKNLITFQGNVIVASPCLESNRLKRMITFRVDSELVCSLHCHRTSWCKVSCLLDNNICYLSDMFLSRSYEERNTQNLVLCATNFGYDFHTEIIEIYKTTRDYALHD